MSEEQTLEERYAALKTRLKDEFHTDLDLAITIGGVRLDALYRLRFLDHEETLEGQLNTLDRIIELPSFAATAHAEAHVQEVEQMAKDVEWLMTARMGDLDVARAQFLLDSDPDLSEKHRDTIQAAIATLIKQAKDDLEEDREKTKAEGESEGESTPPTGEMETI